MSRGRQPNRRKHASGGAGSPPAQTTLALASSTVTVVADLNTAGLAYEDVVITSSGGNPSGPYVSNVTLNSGSGWLTASIVSVSGGYAVRSAVDPTGLSAGTTVTGTITVNDANAIATVQLAVTASIVAVPVGQLGLSTTAAVVSATVGQNPSPNTVTCQLGIVGGGVLGTSSLFGPIVYTGTHTGWASASIDANGLMTVTLTTSGLVGSGSSNARIGVQDSNCWNECAFNVALQMGAAVGNPVLVVSPSNVAATIDPGTNAAQVTLTVSNGGTGTLADLGTITCTEGGAATWISESVNGAQVTLTFATTALASGNYTENLTIAGSSATNGSVVVPVGITVRTTAPVGDPTLPTEYTWSRPAVTGATLIVTGSGTTSNLQTLLNTCSRGDKIVLQAGTTYMGNFILPPRPGSVGVEGWVSIVSSADANIPAGVRFRPTVHGAYAPIIASPNASPAIQTRVPGSNTNTGWYFRGIKFSRDPNHTNINYAVVALGSGRDDGNVPPTIWQNTLAMVPEDFIFDACWSESLDSQNTFRAYEINAKKVAIVNCWVNDGHVTGSENQAIHGINTPGLILLQNNYIAGATQNIMFGGGDPGIPGLNPTDIVIRGNDIYKPLIYKTQPPPLASVKETIEFKVGVRVLLENNIIEGCWTQGQVGFCLGLKSVNQSGAGGQLNIGHVLAETGHVTIRRNLFRNFGTGPGVSGKDPGTCVLAHDILFEENYFELMNVPQYDGTGDHLQLSNNVQNVKFRRNTFYRDPAYAAGNGSYPIHAGIVFLGNGSVPQAANSVTNLTFTDNIIQLGQYGYYASGIAQGEAAITGTTSAVNGAKVYTGNYVIGASTSGYPNTTFVSTLAAAHAAGKGVPYTTIQNYTSGVRVAR